MAPCQQAKQALPDQEEQPNVLIEAMEQAKQEQPNVSIEAMDPFAKRPGHRLDFDEICVSAKGRNKKDLKILHNVSGSVVPKRLCCVLGGSGSGKTTLLHVLAGKLHNESKNLNVTCSSMTLDDVPLHSSSIAVKQKIAFVAQRDTLLATATPREALAFSAKLRLPRETTNAEIDALVERILQELQLSHRADELIGGPNFTGLSGGEMRRVSLGVELVVKPCAIFLDEVTSGLDSYNAARVVKACKRVASAGAAVLLTIHQPSSNVFELIDDLILLKEGRVLYKGDAKEMIPYFRDRQYDLPPLYNPADWMLQVSQGETAKELERKGFFANFPADPIDFDEALESATNKKLRAHSLYVNNIGEHVSFTTELKYQLVREFRNLKRDSHVMALRFCIVAVGSALLAIGFWDVGVESMDSLSSFQSHVGVTFILTLVTVIALQVILLDFIDQRPLFVREYETGHFRMISYGLTKILMEAISTFLQVLLLLLVTFWSIGLNGRFGYWLAVMFIFAMGLTSLGVLLASATKDARNAKELIPMTVLPQLILCGYFVRIDSLPEWLQWAQWIMPLTYSLRLLLNEEFDDCLDNAQDGELANNQPATYFCALFLEELDAVGDKTAEYWQALFVFCVIFRVVALVLLRRKAY